MKKIKNSKQLIINIITIINIIVIIAFIYYIYINNQYSRGKVYEILEKNINNINYSIEIEDNFIKEGKTSFMKIIQKENARKEENITDQSIKWYANDFIIVNTIDEKVYYREENQITDINGNITHSYSTTDDKINKLIYEFSSLVYINNSDIDYKYLKKETYNNQKCIVIELTNIESYSITDIKIWIDLESGFVLKEEYYCEKELERLIRYTTNINCITDNEIKLPDLTEYTFLNELYNF